MKHRAILWIREHPIGAFFLIAISASVGLLLLTLPIPQDTTFGQLATFYLSQLWVYTPVIAGMLVMLVIRPDREAPRTRLSRVPLGRA